jgi:hypothetical protein
MTTKREDIALGLKAIYDAHFTGLTLDSGQVVNPANIHAKMVVDIKQMSPAILIVSDGVDRSGRSVPEGYTAFGGVRNGYLFRVIVLVMLPNAKGNVTYTTAKAHEVLSEIEERIAALHEENDTRDGVWRVITYTRENRIGTYAMEDGTVYVREEIPIAVYS